MSVNKYVLFFGKGQVGRLAVALVCCDGLHVCLSARSRLAALLSSFVARRWVRLQTLGWFYLKTYLLMVWWGPDALTVVRPTGVYQLNFFCLGVRFCVLLGPFLCFVYSADSIPDAVKLYSQKANVCKSFQDIPVYMINQILYRIQNGGTLKLKQKGSQFLFIFRKGVVGGIH